MSDESELRDFIARVQTLKRDTALLRTRWASLQNIPGGDAQLTALLKPVAGLLHALDALDQPADPGTMTLYDKIRAEVARPAGAHPDLSIPLDHRLAR